ncbi:hypothetical protein WMW72_21940 [Paenibacillus filicis]|uniref:Uncharacterized protein n=1 Tax=Paenibacillus filicis TaxID=669464 RepID=A0ABU9DQU4_9BACL
MSIGHYDSYLAADRRSALFAASIHQTFSRWYCSGLISSAARSQYFREWLEIY